MTSKSSIEGLMTIKGLYDMDMGWMREQLEYFVPILREHEGVDVVAIDDVLLDRYQFDLTGLLLHLGVPYPMHWFTMRLSGLNAPTELTRDVKQLVIPPAEVLNRLINTIKSNKKVQR